MNGRAYDYNTGRFLSVDPFIQSPGNSQSVNPYSYIMNNPLSGTDPSGYVSCGAEESATCLDKAKDAGFSSVDITEDGEVVGTFHFNSENKGGVGDMKVIVSVNNGDKNSGGSANSASMTAAKTSKPDEQKGPDPTNVMATQESGSSPTAISSDGSDIHKKTNGRGRELTGHERDIVIESLLPAQQLLTNFINVLHTNDETNSNFRDIMKLYGYLDPNAFDETRQLLIQNARNAINLIGEFTLNPSNFYFSGYGGGEATFYSTHGIIGFGSWFMRAKSLRASIVVHEFGHAIWTGPDGHEGRGHPTLNKYKTIAANARLSRDSDARAVLYNSAYVFEYAVGMAQR